MEIMERKVAFFAQRPAAFATFLKAFFSLIGLEVKWPRMEVNGARRQRERKRKREATTLLLL